MNEPRAELREDQFHEVRFEDFLARAPNVLHEIAESCGLRSAGEIDRAISDAEFRDPTQRHRDDLTREQQEILLDVLSDELERYGYI